MKPILFNTYMVRAILEGRKTVTRRVIKDKDIINAWDCESDGTPIAFIDHETGDSHPPAFPCQYQPGDILYVRETWTYGYVDTTDFECRCNECFFEELKAGTQKDSFLMPRYFYRTENLDGLNVRWRPSIHMPKEAARLFLRVTDVRAERLQAITPEQIDAEGFKEWAYSAKTGELLPSSPSFFRIGWDKTINPADLPLYGWDANPWVWVISFERISKEEALK